MFAITESALQKSWLTGAVANAALVTPVIDARLVNGGNEETIRMLRGLLESVFEQWRNSHGTFPEGDGGLLGSFSIYEGKTIAECPPYACMGNRWADYAALLAKLTAEQYPPLVELETIANGDNLRGNLPDSIPRLPPERQHNFRNGMQRILAALILSEAAAGRVKSAAQAHLELRHIQAENEQRVRKTMLEGQKVIHRFAMTGINKSAQAKRFGQKGAKGNKEEGEVNRKAVLDAAREILEGRTRKPSGRNLAKLIEEKTSIPLNTVRGHLRKLRIDKILD